MSVQPLGKRAFQGKRDSLEETLLHLGISATPREHVKEHKRSALRNSRPGIWRFSAPIILGFGSLCSVLSLNEFRAAYERSRTKRVNVGWFLGQLALLFLLFMLGGRYGANSLTGALLLVPVWASLCLFGCRLFETFAQGRLTHWKRARISSAGKTAPDDGPHGIFPQPLHMKAKKVALFIPHARLATEYLNFSALLLVERGWGPWKEVAYIGAWDLIREEFEL